MKKVLIFLSIVSLVVANDKSDIESLINKHWESWNSNKYKDYISTIHSGGTMNGDSNGSFWYELVPTVKGLTENRKPGISALKEIDEDLQLAHTVTYFLCLKELKRDYDISDLDRLIENEKNDIGEMENYYIFKLIGERSYLKDAYEKVMKTKSNLEPEVAEKYINYPYVKEIIREWERNI